MGHPTTTFFLSGDHGLVDHILKRSGLRDEKEVIVWRPMFYRLCHNNPTLSDYGSISKIRGAAKDTSFTGRNMCRVVVCKSYCRRVEPRLEEGSG